MKAKAITLGLFLSLLVSSLSWGMLKTKSSASGQKVEDAEKDTEDDQEVDPGTFDQRTVSLMDSANKSGVGSISQVVGELTRSLSKLTIDNGFNALGNHTVDAVNASVLTLEYADQILNFPIEMASCGVFVLGEDDVTLTSHLLPQQTIHFAADSANGGEYSFLFPEAVFHELVDSGPVWVQMVFDSEPDLGDCIGCLFRPVPYKVEVSGREMFLVAFPVDSSLQEIRLTLNAPFPDDRAGLIATLSGLVFGDQIVYLQHADVGPTPAYPVLLGYRQLTRGKHVTRCLIMDFGVRYFRPLYQHSLYQREPWLGISAPLKDYGVVDMRRTVAIHALKGMETQTKRAEVRRNLVMAMAKEPGWPEKRADYTEPMKKELIGLVSKIDYHHRTMQDLIAGDQFLTRHLHKMSQKIVSQGQPVPAGLKKMKDVVAYQGMLNSWKYLECLIKSYLHYMAALITEKGYQDQDRWIKENQALCLRIALKLIMAAREMSAFLSLFGQIRERNVEAAAVQVTIAPRFDTLLKTLCALRDFYPLEKEIINDPPGDEEFNTLEQFAQEHLKEALAVLKACLSEKHGDQRQEVINQTVARVVRLLNFGVIIQSASTFQAALTTLYSSGICLSGQSGVSVYRAKLEGTTQDCTPFAGFLQEDVKGERGLRKRDVEQAIKHWLEGLSFYLTGVIDGQVVHSDRGEKNIQLLSAESVKSILSKYIGDQSTENIRLSLGIISLRKLVEELFRQAVITYQLDELMGVERALECSGGQQLSPIQIDLDKEELVIMEEERASVSEAATPPPEDVWLQLMKKARVLAKGGQYPEADQAYEESIKAVDRSSIRAGFSWIERGDIQWLPWRQMLFDLGSSMILIRDFQKRIAGIDLSKLQAIFSSRLSLNFWEYRAIVRDTPQSLRQKIDVPTHEERARFWAAVSHIRDSLTVPSKVVSQTISYYRKALEVIQSVNPDDGRLPLYKKQLVWMKGFRDQLQEATALVKTVKETNQKLVSCLKIMGSYKQGAEAVAGQSWKNLLVKDIESLQPGKTVMAATELGIFDQLRSGGLTESFEWALIPHKKLSSARHRQMGRDFFQKVLWGDLPANAEGVVESNQFMLLPLGAGDLQVREGNKLKAAVIAGRKAVTSVIEEELQKDDPRMILACRSGSEDALCQELKIYSCLACPIRIRQPLRKPTGH